MEHSSIVGGSTAKRVIACPGSVALVSRMPARPSSTFADRGTLLHNVISQILDNDTALPEDFLGTTYENEVLTQELIDEKLLPALAALDEIDPKESCNMRVRAVSILVSICQMLLVVVTFWVVLAIALLYWIGNLGMVLRWVWRRIRS